LIHHGPQKLAAGIGDSRTMVPENILEEMDEDMNSNNDPEDEEEEKVPYSGGSKNLEAMLTKEKYNFLFKRTCFRLMSEFFKSLFLSFVKKEAPGNKKVHKNFKNHI
jgi:hypothetical protein